MMRLWKASWMTDGFLAGLRLGWVEGYYGDRVISSMIKRTSTSASLLCFDGLVI